MSGFQTAVAILLSRGAGYQRQARGASGTGTWDLPETSLIIRLSSEKGPKNHKKTGGGEKEMI